MSSRKHPSMADELQGMRSAVQRPVLTSFPAVGTIGPMDITSEIRSAVSSVARAHGIALVGLFGSLATGQARVGSDVDIAVRFRDRKPTLRRLLEVQRDLSPIFPGREIDIASVERADPLFMKKIAERLVVLFEEAGESAAFLCLAFKRYQDHRRYLAMERDFANRYVEKIAR